MWESERNVQNMLAKETAAEPLHSAPRRAATSNPALAEQPEFVNRFVASDQKT